MQRKTFLSFIVCVIVINFATISFASERTHDESMLSFLPYLNQKVVGYMEKTGMNQLDDDAYRDIVDKVCANLPLCRQRAETMFNTYDIKVRTIDDMFSVMLCDKDGKTKKMEDLSCNEQKVEIPTFQADDTAQCLFEENWKEIVATECRGR